MPSWKTPTTDQVGRAIALIAHSEQHRYFFDHLDNPLWLKPLADKRLFATPPPPVGSPSEGYMHPVWPEARYLARMASKAPQDALDILLTIPPTDNFRVHHDLIDTALALSPDKAALWMTQELPWLEQQRRLSFLLPEKLGELIAHLAQGQESAALALARVVLTVFAEPYGSTSEGETAPELRSHPEGRVDAWDYNRILALARDPLATAFGLKYLVLLADLLDAAVRAELGAGSPPPDDYSSIWRPSIEDGSERDLHEILSGLVTAMRDTSEDLAPARRRLRG